MTDVRERTGPSVATAVPTIPRRRATVHDVFRADIQGLRTLAVSLVVLYHVYPSLITGGYVGVDVFFVISGYLITGLLARGLARTGRAGLLDFYARRARRLLPASILVLTVTWLVAREVMPVTQLSDTAIQIRASALYFQNWVLAGNSTSYLNSDNAPTPVQHFWSLSVEEQFYLVWPLLFVAAAIVAARWTKRAARGVLFALALLVVVLSLRYSIVETRSNTAAAYFLTSTRMWELGVGGVLALMPGRITRALGRIGLLAWLGLAMILISAFTINASTQFPGSAALVPVLGAALMLASGSSAARLSPSGLTTLPSVVFIGGISYSLYLWHWPIIVLWKAYSGGTIGFLDGPAILVVSIVLAWLTKLLVEDPIRTWHVITRTRSRSLGVAALTLIPVALVSAHLWQQPAGVNAVVNSAHPGAAVLAGTARAIADTPMSPSLAEVPKDIAYGSNSKCEGGTDDTAVVACTLGDTTNPIKTVALVGDSHAAQWSDVLDNIAKAQHWKLVVATHVSCPWTATLVNNVGSSKAYTSCHTWGQNVLSNMLKTVKPDVVIVSERPADATPSHPKVDATSQRAIGEGMAQYWKQLTAAGIGVVAIQETPEPGMNIPDCLASHNSSVASCSVSAAKAIPRNTSVDVASAALNGAVTVVDLNSLICSPNTCAPVVGNIVVYRDHHHLDRTYTLSMQPFITGDLLKVKALQANG